MNICVLAGGVGGAKLVDGLSQALAPEAMTVVVNTADDFEHLGLYIAPDLDTIMYTLAGVVHPRQGWGLDGDSEAAMTQIRKLGGPDWFFLGDRDLGTHLMRSDWLRSGQSLTAVTQALCRAYHVQTRVLPMSDQRSPSTIIDTEGRAYRFQDWFVGAACRPRPARIDLSSGPATAEVYAALEDADVIILAPSNPFVSLEPILALDGIRTALRNKPVLSVSPIVAGAAIKGPLASMIESLLGVPPSAEAAMNRYADILDVAVVERGDRFSANYRVVEAETVMRSRADRMALAKTVLALADAV